MLKIAATGFVDAQGGSVASANALILRGLLDRGVEVHFFSKSSFVDPRPCISDPTHFRFYDITNFGPDQLRRRLTKVPVLNQMSGRWDASTYEKLLVRRIGEIHQTEKFSLCLWLGTYAPARVAGLASISFAQGPPGTDARSFLERQSEIASLAGNKTAQKWATLARLRLSKWGLPRFAASDHIIVGSGQSVRTLRDCYQVEATQISACPYPIDLVDFDLPNPQPPRVEEDEEPVLRILWLGRIVPRKRVDMFLDGCALAITRGIPVKLTIVGQTAMIPEYQKLIDEFAFPDRLTWHRRLPRAEIPSLIWEHDVLGQPSDEENFGSSIAEAQACGLPAIVGHTNGNSDYLCSRSIHLSNDRAETFADALKTLFERKKNGQWGSPGTSRAAAQEHFAPDVVVERFLKILRSVA